MGVNEALHITQANISRQALHRRVKRARDKVREKEDAEQAATSLLSLGSSKNPRNKANTLSPPPPKGGLSIITPGPSARKARKATTTTAASSVTLGTRKSPYSTSTTTPHGVFTSYAGRIQALLLHDRHFFTSPLHFARR